MSSESDDENPEWIKRKRAKDPFFGDIDDMFREMEKMMDEKLKNFTDNVPKEYVKERKLPDGSTVKEFRTVRLWLQHEDRSQREA